MINVVGLCGCEAGPAGPLQGKNKNHKIRFTMTERENQLHHDNAPAHSTAIMHAFFWQSITSPRSFSPTPPYSPDLSPCDFWLFPNLKSPLKGRSLLMRRSHSTQAESTASHCRLTCPTGERLFTDAQ